MRRLPLAWAEVVIAFFLLYAGIPWLGFQLDRILALPPMPAVISWIGLPLLVIGALGLGWCFQLLVLRGRGTPNPRMPPQALVTEGPYAWTRNPIVLSHAAALFGLCLFLGTWSGAVLVLLLSIPVHFALRQEEKSLELRFGEAYVAYRASVPRWIPRRPRIRAERTR
jgi:protein-S-isoprenylcysteine O-methyltransferase Ste14